MGQTILPCWDGVGKPLRWSFEGEGRCKYFDLGYTPSPKDGPWVLTTYSPIMCDAGEFAAYGTRNCIKCPKGHFCATPDVPPKKCPPGKYQDLIGQTSCKNCGGSTYSTFGAIMCQTCPEGFACASAAVLPKQCGRGKWSAAGSNSCSDCNTGSGYVCKPGGNTDRPLSLCPEGLACGIDTQTPTVAGKFNANRGEK